jgi:arylsulfatase A-like enzyme
MSDARAAGARPNLLLIATNQQRGDCLGVDRSAHPVLTPHLDQLAAEGIRFTRAYSDCPVCVPARTSISAATSSC